MLFASVYMFRYTTRMYMLACYPVSGPPSHENMLAHHGRSQTGSAGFIMCSHLLLHRICSLPPKPLLPTIVRDTILIQSSRTVLLQSINRNPIVGHIVWTGVHKHMLLWETAHHLSPSTGKYENHIASGVHTIVIYTQWMCLITCVLIYIRIHTLTHTHLLHHPSLRSVDCLHACAPVFLTGWLAGARCQSI